MRSATGTTSTSSNVKESSNQSRKSSDDSDDERKPGADIGSDEDNRNDQSEESGTESGDSTDNYSRPGICALYNIDENIDVDTEEGRMKETYIRRRKGEREPRNIETRIRPLQPLLQPPRIIYPRIDWDNPQTDLVYTKPMYIPPLPEDREEFE